MNKYSLINRKFVLENEANISIKNRAIKFGDGIFETLKICHGIIYDYETHLTRLKSGLKALRIEHDILQLKNYCYSLIKKNNIENGILRISISRGIGSMGYLPADDIKPLEIVEVFNERQPKNKKIIIGVSKIKTLKKQKFLQKAKTSNSIEYILAKMEARQNNHFDDIMLNQQGYISECSSSNIFFVKKDIIYTPALSCDLLPGTIRNKLLKKFPIKIYEINKKVSWLKNIDEIFITNSNLLILSVDELILNGKTIKLQKNIANIASEFIQNDLEKYIKNHQNEA